MIRLVLRDRQLDMAEYKLIVELRRLSVVLSSVGEFTHNEEDCVIQIKVSKARMRTRANTSKRTLAAVIVDIRIVRVLLDRIFEALERFFGIPLFHIYTGDLDETLCKRWEDLDRLQEISLCSLNVTGEEPEWEQSMSYLGLVKTSQGKWSALECPSQV